jgi:hypothetical protein
MHHIILNFPFYIDDIYVVAGFFFIHYRNNDGTLLLLYNELLNYWRNEIFIVVKNKIRNTDFIFISRYINTFQLWWPGSATRTSTRRWTASTKSRIKFTTKINITWMVEGASSTTTLLKVCCHYAKKNYKIYQN